MSDLILFWHRRDLRIADNIGLASARSRTPKVVGLFCLDPHILEQDDIAPARVAYMLGSLESLAQSYRQCGSRLLIVHREPEQVIPTLASELHAIAVYWNWDVEPYAQERDRKVREALKQQGISVHNSWDQLLHGPGEVRTQSGDPYQVYTPFWKNWCAQPKATPAKTLTDCEDLSAAEVDRAKEIGTIALPTLKDLEMSWDNDLPLSPGESAAWTRFETFCDRDRTITTYDEERNLPALDGTSQLSAALKFGTIGIRAIWHAVDDALHRCRSQETKAGIEAWQKELAWREFYQHAMYFFPSLAEGAYRGRMQNFPWDNDDEKFQAWCEGKTGYPIVDAAMHQLNQTGWMHNRCRMIVASFLTKDLLISWQWGERYFMQTLFDGDLSANNGGWQWSASSGMDPKPLRIFNPASQAKKYDPDAQYIRQWLPQLSNLSTNKLIHGTLSKEDCEAYGYPQPIVQHDCQRQLFKDRYQSLSEK